MPISICGNGETIRVHSWLEFQETGPMRQHIPGTPRPTESCDATRFSGLRPPTHHRVNTPTEPKRANPNQTRQPNQTRTSRTLYSRNATVSELQRDRSQTGSSCGANPALLSRCSGDASVRICRGRHVGPSFPTPTPPHADPPSFANDILALYCPRGTLETNIRGLSRASSAPRKPSLREVLISSSVRFGQRSLSCTQRCFIVEHQRDRAGGTRYMRRTRPLVDAWGGRHCLNRARSK
jgi:hypothetical protein